MTYQRFRGGCGILPCGRSECGNAKSTIEPRFLSSDPLDAQTNVPTDVALRFVTYGFSSWIDIADVRVTISEDNGATWNLLFDGINFQPPYDGALSRVFRAGHELIVHVQKTAEWPDFETIQIYFEGHDEFGQVATKATPVVW